MGALTGQPVVVDGLRGEIGEGPFFMVAYGLVYRVRLLPPVRFGVFTSTSPVDSYVREVDLLKALEIDG